MLNNLRKIIQVLSFLLVVFVAQTINVYSAPLSTYQLSWTTKASMPTARHSLGVTNGVNGKIYAIGGNAVDGTILGVNEEYDPETDTWTTKASMPTARTLLGVVSAPNGKIYAIGGQTPQALSVNTTEEYDPETDTWTTKASMPTAREALMVAVAPNGKIYAIGGRERHVVEEYDPATDTWSTKASIPVPVATAGIATTLEGKIIVTAGTQSVFNSLDSLYYQPTEEYDPETDTWTLLASMPPIFCVQQGQVNSEFDHNLGNVGATLGANGRFYVIGGYCNYLRAADFVNEEYDPVSNSWQSALDYMPTARYNLGVTSGSNGKIYAIGGHTVDQVDPFIEGTVGIVEEATIIETTYNLNGKVYIDDNENGFHDEGEAGYEGAEVDLDTSDTDITDINGNYNFSDLESGVYEVKLIIPLGYIQTSTNPISITLNNNATQNFGIIPEITPTPTPIQLAPTADSYIKLGNQNQNEGSSPTLRLQSSGHNRSLLRFDEFAIEAFVGNSQNYSAVLQLTITDNGNNWGTNGRTIDAHRILNNWAEGNGFIVGNSPADKGTGSGATWSCSIDANIANQNDDCAGSTAWDMANQNNWPFITSVSSTALVSNNQTGIVEFDVTSDIQSFVSGSSQNYGWIIKKTNEGQNGNVSFGSKESSFSPKLIITLN